MLIELFVSFFYGYLLAGVLFGVYFLGWGAARIDHDAEALPWPLKILLWPASVALWPLLLRKVWHR